ncbi:MAG: trypsin-like peptidase domain-containing protein [Kiloniellales bacterium]
MAAPVNGLKLRAGSSPIAPRSCRRFLIFSVVGALLSAVVGGAQTPYAHEGDDLPTLAPLMKAVTPGVVNIASRGFIPIERNPLFKDPAIRRFLDDPRLRRYLNLPDRPSGREARSVGSGVIVDADEGHVLTNHHLIEHAEEIDVILSDGRSVSAELLGFDDATDLAVLKIESSRLTAVDWGDSSRLEVGDFVIAVGNPFGLGQTVTMGIVSAIGRFGLGMEGYEDFIQTDASINPGNSGGALVDLRGKLVGINTATFGPGGVSIGIGLAIPSNMARKIMQQIVEYGSVRRGELGVVVHDVTPEIARRHGLGSQQGAIVAELSPGGAAEQAGLLPGDIILALNGETLRDARHLRLSIALIRVGEEASLRVFRAGSTRDLSITIQALGSED